MKIIAAKTRVSLHIILLLYSVELLIYDNDDIL